jgi:hypothetical protein
MQFNLQLLQRLQILFVNHFQPPQSRATSMTASGQWPSFYRSYI